MKCPSCGVDSDRVVDSRSSSDGQAVRRRRECLKCGRRFTTYERLEAEPLRVVKKDGARVTFDRRKVHEGIMRACEKRPVSADQIEAAVQRIHDDIVQEFDREVPTSAIGEKVMEILRDLDQVAYVRFASVYREFKDASDFARTVEEVTTRQTSG